MSFEKKEARKSTQVIYVDGPIIVGAGPSGLAVAACLKQKHAISSLILERSNCIASLWQQKTYDRVKLHLPKKFCELPLLGFPPNYPKYPSKKQFITYLETYAHHFNLCPKFNHPVQCAFFDYDINLWRVITKPSVNNVDNVNNNHDYDYDSVNHDYGDVNDGDYGVEYVSKWVIVATGENAEPLIPEIQGIDKFQGKMVHTSLYKSGSDFEDQKVLVIGCGNSGMEVSLDLCKYNALPHMVVRNSVHVLPREMFGLSTFGVAMALLQWFPLRLVDKILLLVANITLGSTDQVGLRRPKTGPLELKNATGKTPVLDVGALSLIKSGNIKVMEGVKEITKNGAKFTDGQEREFDSIILATGYKSNVPFWLKDCDFFSEDGMPKVPFPNGWKGGKGLYTVGFTRRGLLGTSSDAINVAKDISDQCRSTTNNCQKSSHHEVLISWNNNSNQ